MSKLKPKHSINNSKQTRELLLDFFHENIGTSFEFKKIARRAFGKNKVGNDTLFALLEEFQKNGEIMQLPDNTYSSTKKPKTLEGVVDHVNARFGYVIVGTDTDIYVATADLKSAAHGDTVKVIVKKKKNGGHPIGEVVEVVKRDRTEFVGRIELSKNSFAFVIPDFRKIYQDFFISQKNIGKANHNDKVLFEVIDWGEGSKSPEAKVIEVFGKAGENETEIHSIMAEFGLPLRFPESVIKEAEKIEDKISESEIKKRRDFRDVTTFTIDPEDAKDFDDAISVKKIDDNLWEIGVHIADVTHYVRPGMVMDDDASERGTSVYLVDRTVPMLPERLSNMICSLRPDEIKLTFSVVFEMDNNAKIHKEWFGRTVILSDHRFTYELAQEAIDSGEGKYASELQTLNKLAKKLRKQRFLNGSVNFETTEVKFELDSTGKPLKVIPKVRNDSNKLIEEFMLLANKAVATYIHKLKKGKDKNTFVFRTHDHPDQEKIEDFARFAKQFGYQIQTENNSLSFSLNKLMENIEGKAEQNALQSLAIRSMAKAKYTTEAKGHFGLAFEHYTHFTSPIRRYPDMMVHRLIQHYHDNGMAVNKLEYEAKCEHASSMEKRAADAERASIKFKQMEFMSMAQNRIFEGIITGVIDFGLFVEITETKCEGMVRLSDLKDDYYEFDEKNYRIVGRRRNKIFRLGDPLLVRIKKVDINKRTMDLTLEQSVATKPESRKKWKHGKK